MKGLYIILFLFGFSHLGYSQTLERSVIGSAGQLVSAGGIQLSSSVGESVVNTSKKATLTITQGFQQTYAKKTEEPVDTTGVAEFQVIGMKMYPNPTHEYVQLACTDCGTVQFRVVDAIGKVVLMEQFNFRDSNETSISVASWSTGAYYFYLSEVDSPRQGTYTLLKE
ncbi:MAG: T9SS type A sorting domain-containing protein [Flavobacteriales bacterium]|nr:T9SS type A sorting domain-containing protein [Flavobacteriales bacterium]